jgi:elongation factor G
MKVYQPNELKNIALIGSAGSGKTTLAEAMLYEGGVVNRKGDIDSKNTVSDYHDIEHQQGRSIFSTVLYTEYQNKKLNIIDTPGLDDFVGGVVSSLAVSDAALFLISGHQGVEVGTEIMTRHTTKFNTPIIFAINQLDHEKANYDKAVDDLKMKHGGKAVQVQYPVNPGIEFNAVIDVLKMKMYKWGPEGGEPSIEDIPESEKDKAEELHNALVESAAENDEELMELFFEEGTLNEDQMRAGIKKGLINKDLFPIFCVSAKKDMGVRRLMEFLNNVAPQTSEMPKPVDIDGKEVTIDPEGPASIFVFKTSVEEHLGEVAYFKVMSGKISEGMDMINARSGNKERLSQLYCVAGNNRTKIDTMVAGDIGATVKLKDTNTNDTHNIKVTDWRFPAIQFPAPKYRTAIRPVNQGEEEKLGEILNRFAGEDPTYVIEHSKELKQVIVHGQGEFHLNTLKKQIEAHDKLEIEFITPKIPYRETITKSAQADYRHKKQSGGSGQFGEVHMVIEAYHEGSETPKSYKIDGKEISVTNRGEDTHELPWGGKLVFVNSIVGGSIDAKYLPAILKGVMEKMEEGPLTGSYARDIRIVVYDGKMHPVDSNEISFKIAGMQAFRSAFKQAGPKILEPVYKVEVMVPGEFMGDVMSDLQGRRAMIEGMNSEGGYEKISAKVPLAEMNKYSTSLSSLTSGQAMYTMTFDSYMAVPGDVQEQLLKAYEAEQAEAE